MPPLPAAEPEQLEQALSLQAEAALLGVAPEHRMASAVIDAAPGETNRAGLVIAWPENAPDLAAPIAYPIAVGATAAAHSCPLDATLTLYLHSFCGLLVAAGQKLVPLGQTDAQRIVAALNDRIEQLAAETQTTDLDDLGGAALRGDIASMRHETQQVRLYRS